MNTRDRPRTGRNPCEACVVNDTGICAALNEEDMARLEAISSHRQYAPRTTIFHEEDPAETVYNLKSGIVRLTKYLADGRRSITGFVYPGEFLGLPFRDFYDCTAEAITPVALCSYSRTQLETLLKEVAALETGLLRNAFDEIAALHGQLILLGRKTPEEKLATFLIGHAQRIPPHGDSRLVNIPMTRGDIADYLGLTIETISRTFTKMSRDGLIRLRNTNEVEFIRPQDLENLAEGGFDRATM